MAVILTIEVDNPATVVLSYDKIKVYSATSKSGTYAEITTASTRLAISSATTYSYTDLNGTATTWYRTSFFNSTTSAESSLSTPRQGLPDRNYQGTTFPPEVQLSTSEQTVINWIRQTIGDYKELRRDYVNDCYDNVFEDRLVYELQDKGWPVKVRLDGREFSVAHVQTNFNPTVDGNKFITFTGITGKVITTTGILDVWYNTFRFSDKEILEAYDNTTTPAGIPTANATTEMYILKASISILEGEIWQDMINAGSRVVDGDTTFDPSPGLAGRQRMIDSLKTRLDDVVRKARSGIFTGVRID